MGDSEANGRKRYSFEEIWPVLQEGINMLIDTIEGGYQNQITTQDYMKLYSAAYLICCDDRRGAEKLYEEYQKAFEDYISSKVMPHLRGHKGENLLRELVKQWNNYKFFQRYLSAFFHYVDRDYVSRRSLPDLKEVGFANFACYRDLVREQEFNRKVMDEVISMIDQERQGEEIDRELLKKVLEIIVEIGNYKNFEEAILEDTAGYYSQEASNWISKGSYSDYMLKVKECLNREKDRASHYLHPSTEAKLVEVLRHELLIVQASQLEEMKQSTDQAAA